MTVKQFEDAFHKYADAHATLMLAHVKDKAYPVYPMLETIFEKGSYRHRIREIPSYAGLTPVIQDPDFPMKLATECVEIGLQEKILPIPEMTDAAGRPITNPTFEQLKWPGLAELRWPIVLAFQRHGLKRLTRKQILAAFRPYLRAWRAKASPVITFSPLRNFDGDFSEIHLPHDVSILRVSDALRNSLWNPHLMEQIVPIRYFASSPYFIIQKYRPRLGAERSDSIAHVVEEVITALRLLKSGDVGIDGLSTIPVLPGVLVGSFSPQRHLQLDFVFPGQPYKLENRDIRQFHRLFKLSSSLTPSRKDEFKIPISRFNRMYSRRDGDDSIIDIAICLESLLLRGVDRELSYRLAVRGATPLRRLKPKHEVFGLLTEFYKLRSKVVHEGEHLFTSGGEKRIARLFPGLTADKFIEQIRTLVRRVILEMLPKVSQGMSIHRICEELDKEALR